MEENQSNHHNKNRGHNRQQSLPGSPGVHSDEVSLGSHVWPARLPAHSFASEPAAPILTGDTYCILFKVPFPPPSVPFNTELYNY